MPPTRRKVTSSILALLLPVLVALFAPLSLISSNLGEVDPTAGIRSIVVLALAALGLTLAAAAIFRSLAKGILLAAIVLVVLLSYGHVYNVVRHLSISGVLLGRHRYLLPVALGLIVLSMVGIRAANALRLESLASMALVALGMVAWTSAPTVRAALTAKAAEATAAAVAPDVSMDESAAKGDLPDIYYIVLDGHGRADSLKSIYGYDSTPFVESLEAMGFYVADSSQSNYAMTSLSLASSLNMTHLTDLVDAVGGDESAHQAAEAMLNRSLVFEMAERLGYETIAFESAAPAITFDSADELLAADFTKFGQESALLGGFSLTPFEGILLESTIGRLLFDWLVEEQNRLRPLISDIQYQRHRERILFQLQSLPTLAERAGPKFVVVHLMSPHPPFVFGPRGEQVANHRAFSLQDVGCCDTEEYVSRYRDQVTYVDRILAQSLEGILDASPATPIIVIQGDHGPGSTLNWRRPSEEGRQERMAILNAYLVPERCRNKLYPDISPVNTFRLVFGSCLGRESDLLPDESHFSTYWRRFDFTTVEDREFE